MSRIRPVHKIVIVASLVAGLLLADTLRPAPTVADTKTDVIIACSAFAGYMLLIGGLTWILYVRKSEEKPPETRRDPYSFTSDASRRTSWDGRVQFGSKCASHGPGALLCW